MPGPEAEVSDAYRSCLPVSAWATDWMMKMQRYGPWEADQMLGAMNGDSQAAMATAGTRLDAWFTANGCEVESVRLDPDHG